MITDSEPEYSDKYELFSEITCGKFPILSIIQIEITEISTIIAPSYWLFPDISEQEQIQQAMQTYGVRPDS